MYALKRFETVIAFVNFAGRCVVAPINDALWDRLMSLSVPVFHTFRPSIAGSKCGT